MLICHLHIFLGEVSAQVFCPFFNRVVPFLIVEFCNTMFLRVHLWIIECRGREHPRNRAADPSYFRDVKNQAQRNSDGAKLGQAETASQEFSAPSPSACHRATSFVSSELPRDRSHTWPPVCPSPTPSWHTFSQCVWEGGRNDLSSGLQASFPPLTSLICEGRRERRE